METIATAAAAALVAAACIAVIRRATGATWRERAEHELEQLRINAARDILTAAAQHQHPLPPAHLHYAPHIRNTGSNPRLPLDDQAEQLPRQADASSTPPTLGQMIESGIIGSGQPLILGHTNDGQTITATWLQLYSSAIGGLSGTGKSWTAAAILGQSALNGAQLAIIDPDAPDPESLTSRIGPLAARFLCEPAEDDETITQIVQLVSSEIENRRSGRSQRRPLVLAIDEYNSLATRLPALADLVELIATRGRRQSVYSLCLSHQWQGHKVGGAALRDAFASAFIMRMRPAQARMLTGLPAHDLPPDLLDLPPGAAYLLDTAGRMTRLQTPYATPADIQHIGSMLTDQAPTSEAAAEAAPKAAHTAAAPATAVTAEEAQILALVRSGESVSKIIETVWGVKGGSRYKERSAEVMAIIRSHLK
jgi:hypothetical protein